MRSISMCSALSHADAVRLQSLSSDAQFAKNEPIAIAGNKARWIYVITAGMVRVHRSLSDGRRQIVGFLMEGDLLGVECSDQYRFTAEAVTVVNACRFPEAKFSTLAAETPGLMQRLYEEATHELALAHEHMVLLGRFTAEEKLASFLISLRDRRRRFGGGHVTIPLPMTRGDIADHLGLTFETISRTIRKLSDAKALVVVPGGVRLINPDRMAALAAA